MAATVESVFKILDRASPTLDKITRRAQVLDDKLSGVGRGFDKLSSQGAADLDVLDRSMRDTERQGAKTGTVLDKEMSSAARSIRDMTAQGKSDLGVLDNSLTDTGQQASQTSSRVSASMEAMSRSVANSTSSSQRDLTQLQASLATLDATKATPEVNLQGVEEAIAKIGTLDAALSSLDGKTVNVNVRATESIEGRAGGVLSNLFGKGGRSAGRAATPQRGGAFAQAKSAAGAAVQREFTSIMSQKARSMFEFLIPGGKTGLFSKKSATDVVDTAAGPGGISGNTKKLGVFSKAWDFLTTRVTAFGTAILGLGPIIEPFIGSIAALAGSLGAGTLAGGAGLVGLLGTAVVGFGGLAGVMLPMMTRLKALSTAQTAYNTAIATYGKNSAQAVTAAKQLNAAQQAAGPARMIMNRFQSFKDTFTRRTAAGQRDAAQGLAQSIQTLGTGDMMDTLVQAGNRGGSGFKDLMAGFTDILDSPMFRKDIDILSKLFDRLSGGFGRGVGNLVRLFANISAAAKPLVVDFIKWFDQWTRNAARNSSHLSKVGDMFKSWEKDFKAWIRFFKQLILLAGAFFGAGRRSGRGLLTDMTKQIREWRTEIQQDPSKVKSWFSRMVDDTKALTKEIGALVAQLGKLVDMLTQVIGPITSFSAGIRNIVPGNTILDNVASMGITGGLLFGGAAGVKGLVRGGLARGAGALGAEGLAARVAGEGYLAQKIGGITKATTVAESAAPEAATATEATTAGEAAAGGIGMAPIAAGLAAAYGTYGAFTSEGGLQSTHIQGVDLGPVHLGIPMTGHSDMTPQITDSLAKSIGSSIQQAASKGNLSALTQLRKQAEGIGHALGETGKKSSELLQVGAAARKASQDIKAAQVPDKLADIQKAFQIRVKGGQTPIEAFSKTLNDLPQELKGVGEKGRKQMLTNVNDWATQLAKANPKMRPLLSDLQDMITNRFKNMGENVAIINGNIYDGSQRTWAKIREGMTTQAERAREEVSKSFTQLQMQAIGSLQAMGYTASQAKALMKSAELTQTQGTSPSQQGSVGGRALGAQGAHGSGPLRARGGVVPGGDMRDTVPVAGALAGGGERVVNQHTMARIDHMLNPYGTSTDREIGKESRVHSFPMPQRARGGTVPGHPELHPGISRASEAVLTKFPGLTITSTTGGTHASGSYHYLGEAADIAGDTATMLRAASWVKATMGSGLTEGIHNPNLSIKDGKTVPSSYWGASTWADHMDHIHLAVAGALGAIKGGAGGTGQALSLKAPSTKLGGVPGAMSQRGMNAVAKGMQDKINKKIAASAAEGSAGYLPGGGGPVVAQIGRILLQQGLNKVGAAGIIGNAYAESSWNPGAVGTGGGGLWGFTASPISLADLQSFAARSNKPWQDVGIQTQFLLQHMSGGLIHQLNAAGSAADAATVFMNEWERPGIPRLDVRISGAQKAFQMGYGRGGQLPHAGAYGQGGSFDVYKPTTFVAGDGGKEHVQVTPAHRQSAAKGGARVQVHIAKIENHREGDVAKVLENEFKKLGIAIRMTGDESHESVMDD